MCFLLFLFFSSHVSAFSSLPSYHLPPASLSLHSSLWFFYLSFCLFRAQFITNRHFYNHSLSWALYHGIIFLPNPHSLAIIHSFPNQTLPPSCLRFILPSFAFSLPLKWIFVKTQGRVCFSSSPSPSLSQKNEYFLLPTLHVCWKLSLRDAVRYIFICFLSFWFMPTDTFQGRANVIYSLGCVCVREKGAVLV